MIGQIRRLLADMEVVLEVADFSGENLDPPHVPLRTESGYDLP
jgi:hypothetical protein